jgi:hypothetical protein
MFMTTILKNTVVGGTAARIQRQPQCRNLQAHQALLRYKPFIFRNQAARYELARSLH